MAQKVSVIITDDLDGSAGARTTTFSLDGQTYEIDLVEANEERLRDALGPFMQAARRVNGGRRQRPATMTRIRVPSDGKAIRAWAKSNSVTVSERGRISADVVRRYEEAMAS